MCLPKLLMPCWEIHTKPFLIVSVSFIYIKPTILSYPKFAQNSCAYCEENLIVGNGSGSEIKFLLFSDVDIKIQ